MLLAIEGITNSGKTTLCNHIIDSHCCAFDIYDKSNIVQNHIRQITHDESNEGLFTDKTELFLYTSLLAEKARQIESSSNSFLIDRFSLSVFSYFYSKFDFDSAFLHDLISFASNRIVPDLTILVDTPLRIILSRAEQCPMSRKDLGLSSYYYRLRDAYISNLSYYSKEYLIVDGAMGEYDLAEMVIDIIRNRLK